MTVPEIAASPRSLGPLVPTTGSALSSRGLSGRGCVLSAGMASLAGEASARFVGDAGAPSMGLELEADSCSLAASVGGVLAL